MPLNNDKSPLKFMWLSIAASFFTITLKLSAYYITGSIGLLSDAMESFINLAAGIVALVMLTIAIIPPDREHPFGHNKAEYFSSVTEGVLILVAAAAIGITAVMRLMNPKEIDYLGFGLGISVFASVINFFTAMILLKGGEKYQSITLEADGKHLVTDVWTTVGVIVSLLVVKFTGWIILDPVIAIIVALNIVYTGIKLIIRSVSGLMDSALPENEQLKIKLILEEYEKDNIRYHSLYTRQAASRRFISLHLLVPGNWHISRGHEITKNIEGKIKSTFPDSDVFIHIEPLNDPDSFDDYLEK